MKEIDFMAPLTEKPATDEDEAPPFDYEPRESDEREHQDEPDDDREHDGSLPPATNGHASGPRVAPTVDLLRFPLTDLGNAERLVAVHGAGLRYVPLWNRWLAWTGSRWAPDPQSVRVYRAAKGMVRELVRVAAAVKDDERRKALLSFALACEGKKLLGAMVSLAQNEPAVHADHTDFDRDPMLLNVANGTIDLRTGDLRPHRREDMITKISPVEYDPQAKCPRFDRFLLEVMNEDAELVAFVLAFLGYCLTGDVREHVVSFWHGKGGNGKGVLGAAILHVMGDYAIKAAPDLLFRSDMTDRHPTELADLHGKRLVICNETTRGRAWDEGTLKDCTGARRMREDFWEFDPTHKLVVWGNHKPVIRNVDDAMRRRLRLVPFAVSFVGREDKGLVPALQREAPGILRRLVEGSIRWQEKGLPDAAAVRASTDGYLQDEDTLGQFFAEECIFAPDAKVTRKALRDAYVAWSAERDEKPVGAKVFAQRLRDRGALDRRIRTEAGSRAGWVGVRLVTDAERPAPDEPGTQVELV